MCRVPPLSPRTATLFPSATLFRSWLIELLVAFPFAAGDPPGGALWHDVEFGDFAGDLRGWQPRLLGQFIAEADAVVEQAETDVHRVPAPAFILAEADEQFVVAVAHEAAFAPRLFPARIAARALGALDRETRSEEHTSEPQ